MFKIYNLRLLNLLNQSNFFSFFDLKEEFHKHIKNQNSKENCDLIDLKESTNIEVEFMLKGLPYFLNNEN